MFKLRIIVKSLILSVLHYNALYLFSLVLGFEAFFILFKMRLSKLKFPKLWLVSNILINLSLLLLVELSHSLASIYVSTLLATVSLLLELIILVKEYK